MLKNKRLLSLVMALVMVWSVFPLQAFAVETPEQGEDNTGTDVILTAEGPTVEPAKGGEIEFTYSDSVTYWADEASGMYLFQVALNESGSFLVSNTSTQNLIWSFDFEGTNGAINITADGNPVGSNGITLYPGSSVTIGFTVNEDGGYLLLSNFTSEKATAGNVQIVYNADLGTVKVNGAEVASGTTVSIPNTGAAIEAIPNSGAGFIGWVNPADHTYKDTASISNFTAANGQTVVEAAFTAPNEKAWFYAGKNDAYLYDDLTAAAAFAATQDYNEPESWEIWDTAYDYRIVTLAASGTLAKDTYIIASGAKLLIPRTVNDDGVFGTTPNRSTTQYGSSQTAFRTLKVADGAVLNFTGSSQLNINGSVYNVNGSYSGVTTGAYGCIDLGEDAKINMNSGSTLYCYGYIIGDGEVLANDGSTVYEVFQATGWRGGTAGLAWRSASHIKNFIFNDFAVQNIEADLVVNYGATIGVSATVNAGGVPATTAETYIGKYATNGGSGLLRLESGASVRRSYTPETNRMKYSLRGNAHIASIDLSVDLGLMGDITMNTSTKILSIPYYWDLVAEKDSFVTLHNDYKLLPGATLTVEKDATALVKGNLYIYDTDDYVGKGYTSSGNSVPVRYVASTGATAGSLPKMKSSSPSGQVIIDGTLTVNGGIFTTANGGTSVNKVLKGSGTFINNSTKTTDDVGLDEYTYSDGVVDHNITVVPVVGQIAGVSTGSEYHSFANGEYYGLGDGFWYQHIVSTHAFGDIKNFKNLPEAVTTGVNGNHTVTQNGSTISNVVGFISDYLAIQETTNAETGEVTGYTSSVVTTPFTFSVAARTKVEADGNGTLTGSGTVADPYVLTVTEGNTVVRCEANVAGENEILMKYDDHLDISGYSTFEINDAGNPTSYQVGYGVEENAVPDTAVVTLEGNYLVATGIGEATVTVDGIEKTVIVDAAPISMLFLGGQSNMQGSRGDGRESIVCEEGMVYGTYGDRYKMNTSNATQYAPSALTGSNSLINVKGTTASLSDYPVMMHNAGVATTTANSNYGLGKNGPDSGFAYQWVKSTGEKVWVINAAHGGSSLASWLDGGANYEEAVLLFKACQETMRKEIAAGHYTLSHMGFYWCQGESDCTNTAEYYATNFLKMYESLKADLRADMDSDSNTPDRTIEFTNIVLTFAGSLSSIGYRYDADEGLYTAGDNSGWRTHEELEMRGQRVAQLWLGANPAYPDINVVCNIADGWYTMPDGAEIPNGTLSVADYFQKHYAGGVIDYPTQVEQTDAWRTPDSPEDVRCTKTDGAARLHYNQRGFNEIGREAVRNTMILLGYAQDPASVETEVTFYDWTGFREVESIKATTDGQSSTLVVPVVSPIYRSKDVTYTTSDGLDYVYYDLIAESRAVEGTLQARGANVATVDVTSRELAEFRWDFVDSKFVSSGPVENEAHYISGAVSNGVFENVQAKLEDAVILKQDQNWLVEIKMINTWTKAVTKILADNGGARADGDVSLAAGIDSILFSYYDGGHENYGASGLMEAGDTTPHTFRLYNVANASNGRNQIYVTVDGGDPVAMDSAVNGQDFHFAYIGTISTEYPLTGGYIEYIYIKETGAAADMHIHQWGEWEVTTEPTLEAVGQESRKCSCGETETREVPCLQPPAVYYWILEDDVLVSYDKHGATANALVDTQTGTITNGVTNNAQYKITTPIVLEPTKEWAVEWNMSGVTTSWQKLLATNASRANGDISIMMKGSGIYIGHYKYSATLAKTTHINYIPNELTALGMDLTANHTYRLENRLNEDETNTIYLLIDEVEIGAMDYDSSHAADDTTWDDEMSITFGYIGQTNYPLNGAAINYIKVQLDDAIDNEVNVNHVWSESPEWSWTGSDEDGYTAATATFTCDCGESEIVEATLNEEVTLEPTVETEGTKVYTATVDFNEETYTAEKTVTLPVIQEEEPEEPEQPATKPTYRWELQGTQMVSTGKVDNALIYQAGSVNAETKIFTNLYYHLTDSVVLAQDQEWTVEIKMVNTWEKAVTKILSNNGGSRVKGDVAISGGSAGVGFSFTLATGGSHGNCLVSGLTAADDTEYHVYRIFNVVDEENNTNTVFLSFDNGDPIAIPDNATKGTTPNGHDYTINTIGTVSGQYPLTNGSIECISIDIPDVHVYGEPEWSWTGDDENGYTAASAIFACECGATKTVEAVVTSETTDATATEDGSVVYTATVTLSEDEVYTDTKTVVIPKLDGPDVSGTWYRWELNADRSELVSVNTDGYTENVLTNKVGTISNGVTSGLQYKFTTPVVLDADKDWTIEWEMSGSNTSAWQKILVSKEKALVATDYCIMVKGETLSLGKYTTTHFNYNLPAEVASAGISLVDQHKYMLENRIDNNGDNTVHLWIDDVYCGPMASSTATWLPNTDITFNYIGQQNKYQLKGATINYIEVYLGDNPAEEHVHSYNEGVVTTQPNCTAGGIMTYTCSICGDTYKGIIIATGHNYGSEWKVDDTNHWYECTCGVKSEEASHVDQSEEDHKCDTCGYEMSTCADGIDADHNCDTCGAADITAHSFIDVVSDTFKITDATCTQAATYYKSCACGEKGTETFEFGVSNGHSYGDPEWTWTGTDTEGYTAAAAKFTCVCSDVQTVEDKQIDVVTTDATYEAAGSKVYTASITFENKSYTDTKTVEIPKLEAVGTTVNFVNYTAGTNKAVVTVNGATVDYKQKEAVSATLGADGAFTVTCAKSCVVAYTTDGVSYTKVTGTKTNGIYSFTIAEPVENMTIAVLYTGDVDGSGIVDATDAALVLRGVAQLDAMSSLREIVADVNNSGIMDATDAAKILRVVAQLDPDF